METHLDLADRRRIAFFLKGREKPPDVPIRLWHALEWATCWLIDSETWRALCDVVPGLQNCEASGLRGHYIADVRERLDQVSP